MSYTITETNLERQHLLSGVLNPLSLSALEKIKLVKGASIADIGCGLGDTTLLLSEQFPGCVLTGIDQDLDLINAARDEKRIYSNIEFVRGDALNLPFADNHFDFVFTRYLLHHIPGSIAVLKEMKRICKPGGMIMAQEPDLSLILSYPENEAYSMLQKVVTELFADVHQGRKLVNLYQKISLTDISYDIRAVLADQSSPLKKFYALTAEAMREAILSRNIMSRTGVEDWVNELTKLQHDPQTIVIMHPSIAVWGTKPTI